MSEKQSSIKDESSNLVDQKTVEELRQGMIQIDQAFLVFTPSLQWFEQKVIEEKKKNRKRFFLELGLFWIISLLIITIAGMVIYQKPIIFLFLQVVAFVILAYIALVKGREQVVD